MRNSCEQNLRFIDVDGGRNRTDKPNQLLAGDHSDTTVPLGQPAWGTQRPGGETHAVVTAHSTPKVLHAPPAASLKHPQTCSRPLRHPGRRTRGDHRVTLQEHWEAFLLLLA